MTSSDEKQAFSDRLNRALKRYRKKIDTATALANQFNLSHTGEPITPQAAQKWLHGKGLPSEDKIATLAKMLGVSSQWLKLGIPELRQDVLLAPGDMPAGASDREAKLLTQFRLLTSFQQELVFQLIEQLVQERQMWMPANGSEGSNPSLTE